MLGPAAMRSGSSQFISFFWAKLEKQLEEELGKEVDKGLDKVVDVH